MKFAGRSQTTEHKQTGIFTISIADHKILTVTQKAFRAMSPHPINEDVHDEATHLHYKYTAVCD